MGDYDYEDEDLDVFQEQDEPFWEGEVGLPW
jgi:hypothetical protein